MTKAEICEVLDRIPLFCGLKEKDITEIPEEVKLSSSDTYEIRRGIVVIKEGKAEIYKKEAFLKSVTAPSVVGIATLFESEENYISTIVAKTEMTLFIFSENFIDSLIKTNPDFSKRLVNFLCEKLRYLNRRIDFYTSSSAESKLREFLEVSAGEKGYVEISMSRLSEVLDIGRASLYRALKSLEEKGYAQKQGKKIFLNK